ncbi:MAG: hypothetical protein Ct9H90mP27_7230 [Gammaproteobacteria bacterium]|nr:MAG: hypothetical protein Ct9H90mP27_7230 [Gammaproteobacteria bacterium]
MEQGNFDLLQSADAILVPGGFGSRGFEGKIAAARYARENRIPYLGICYGLHAVVIDVARNCVGLAVLTVLRFLTSLSTQLSL